MIIEYLLLILSDGASVSEKLRPMYALHCQLTLLEDLLIPSSKWAIVVDDILLHHVLGLRGAHGDEA